MNTDIKQAMHVEAGKSFGTAEAMKRTTLGMMTKIERKNQDPTNHYDKSRMGLNFEIGPDGKIHPLGYQRESLEVRLMDRLSELGWHPFKADSKIQPNWLCQIHIRRQPRPHSRNGIRRPGRQSGQGGGQQPPPAMSGNRTMGKRCL